MNKKVLNIIILFFVVFSFVATAYTLYNLIVVANGSARMWRWINEDTETAALVLVRMKNEHFALPLTISSFVFAIITLLFSITLLVGINHCEIKSVAIDFTNRRIEKQKRIAEKQRLKDEAKKEKLQKQLDELKKRDE